jgi:hypothetical protein
MTGSGVSFSIPVLANNSITASSGTFTNTGDYSILTSSGIKMNAGTIQIGGLTGNQLVTTDGSKNLTNSITSANLANSVTDETGSGYLVFNTNPSFATGITVTGFGNFSQGITASSGTFTSASGIYSPQVKFANNVIISSASSSNYGGIYVSTHIYIANLSRIIGLPTPTDSSEAANKNYVDNATGGGLAANAWLKGGNTLTSDEKLGDSSSILGYDVIFIRKNSEQFRMTSNGVSFSVPILSNSSLTGSTATLTGNAFSVGTSTFVVTQGKVGIGVSSPNTIFHVRGGTVRVENSSGQDSIIISGRNGGTGNYAVTITPTTLNGNRTLTLTDGDTTLVSGTMVPTTTAINTQTPLSGGGDLSISRTLTVGGLNNMGNSNYVVGVNNSATGWEYKNIVGTANEINITPTAGQIEIGIVDPLNPTKGGTGQSTVAQGDILYGSAANTWARLSAAASGNVLISGTTPSWGKVGLTTHVSGILPISNGGTNNTGFIQNQPVIYDGSKLTSFAGFNGNFTVAKSTDTSQGCVQMTYQYGILTSTTTVNCP